MQWMQEQDNRGNNRIEDRYNRLLSPVFSIPQIQMSDIGGKAMAKRAFISFDYDHDSDLKIMLLGQARNPDSPFEIADYSVKEALVGDWRKKVKEQLKLVGVVIVICGEHTNSAAGVSAELEIARELGKEYFLLWGRSDKTCLKPKSAMESDKIYKWTWDNLKALIGGAR